MNPGTGLGLNLIFFLYLLIPGYVTLRAYLWANVALDDLPRLDKLVHLAIGGFLSMTGVSLLRKGQVLYAMWDWSPFTLPSWFQITEAELEIGSVAELSILQSFSLIVSQALVGLFLGLFWGMFKYVFVDSAESTRGELLEPWEVVRQESSVGERIAIVTTDGKEILGTIEQLGTPSNDYDILLSDPEEIVQHHDSPTTRKCGKASYHHHRDISRVEFIDGSPMYESDYSRYIRFLQLLVSIREKVGAKYRETVRAERLKLQELSARIGGSQEETVEVDLDTNEDKEEGNRDRASK